jgi:hypothetical protein
MPVTSFNLSAEANQLIEAIKSGLGLDNKSVVVELAIREMVQNRQAKEAEKKMEQELKNTILKAMHQEIEQSLENLAQSAQPSQLEGNRQEVEFSEHIARIAIGFSWLNERHPLTPEAAKTILEILAKQEGQIYQTAQAKIQEFAQKYQPLSTKGLPALSDAQQLASFMIQKEFEPGVIHLQAARRFVEQSVAGQ